MKGQFIPEIPGENGSCPGNKYPDPDRPEIKFANPDRPEIKFPDLTRPENILKNVPRPRTGFDPVQSGETWGFRLPRRSLTVRLRWFILKPWWEETSCGFTAGHNKVIKVPVDVLHFLTLCRKVVLKETTPGQTTVTGDLGSTQTGMMDNLIAGKSGSLDNRKISS